VKALDPTHSYTAYPNTERKEEEEKNETTMSYLTRPFTRRSALTSSHFLTSPLTLSTSRPFHKANILSALSESDHGRHDSVEDHKAEIDQHKEDLLRNQKDGKGEWKGELSSNSEAAIKADREETDAPEVNIAKLQKETSERAQAEHNKSK